MVGNTDVRKIVAPIAFDSKRKQTLMFSGSGDSDMNDGKLRRLVGGTWQLVKDLPCLGREDASLAYDSKRDRLVLFGGRNVSESGPGPCSWPGLVYDSKRKRIILFGGRDEKGQFYSDTWAWNGKVWKRIATEGPPTRIQFAMGYDPLRDRIVLFGGVNNEPQRVLNDLWEFDGTRWTQKQP